MASQFLFHPVLVHFPIAFYLLELVLLVVWARKRAAVYHRFALISFKLGYLFMTFAMITGFLDAGGFKGIGGEVSRHFYVALSVFILYTARAGYLWTAKERTQTYIFLHLAGAVIGAILVGYAAYLGGRLVYA